MSIMPADIVRDIIIGLEGGIAALIVRMRNKIEKTLTSTIEDLRKDIDSLIKQHILEEHKDGS
jgi:hypothetical protein